jgi:hypothetical protein
VPTVPTIRPIGTVQAPLRGGQITARATPDAFGSGIGEGISNLSGAAFSIYRQERQNINEAAVLEVDTIDAQDDLAARRQLEQAKGKDAGVLFGTLEEARAKRQGEIERNLSNPVQQEAFRRRSASRLQEFRAWGSGHVAREAEAYDGQVAEASITASMERVASNRNDWGEAARITEQAIDDYKAYAQRRGVPPEMRAMREQQIRSGATRRVAEGLIADGNDLAAKRLVDQYGAYFTEDDRKAVGKLLEIGSRDGAAQRLVDGWMKDGMDVADLQRRLTETPELQQDTKLRDEVQARAVQAINLRETGRKAVEHNAYAKAYQIIQDPTKSYSDIPADLKAQLESRPDLDLHLRQLSAKADRVTVTDRATYYELQAEAAANPKGFAKRNLMDYATRLSDGDFKEMVKLQTEAAEGKGENLGWLTTREDVVNQALAGVGIDPRPYRVEQGKTVANPQAVAFRSAVEREANQRAQSAGRRLPNFDDVRASTDAVMLRKVRLDEWGSDPERIAATVVGDERGKAYVPLEQIPGGQAEAIRTLIRNAGGNPTDDRVQRAMAARVLDDRDLLDQIIRER